MQSILGDRLSNKKQKKGQKKEIIDSQYKITALANPCVPNAQL